MVEGVVQRVAAIQELAHAAVDVDRVVHANADTQGCHRQRVHLEADVEVSHQGVGKHRHQRQRNDDGQGRTQRQEGQQAENDYRGVDPAQHRHLRLGDLLVGGRHHAGIAGGQSQVDATVLEYLAVLLCLLFQRLHLDAEVGTEVAVVFVTIGLHRIDHAIDGFRLVVLEEDHDRHGRTTNVQQARVSLDVGQRLAHHKAVTRDGAPAQVALVPAGGDDLGHVGKRDYLVHAFDVLHVPGETVDLLHHRIAFRAALLGSLGDDIDRVDTQAEVLGDGAGILVEARLLAQLRHAGFGITDLHVLCLLPSEPAQARRNDDGDQRRHRPRECRQRLPDRAGMRRLADTALAELVVALAEAGVGQQYRQQHQVGEDDHRYADRCRDRQLLNDPDVDEQDGDEADAVRQQGNGSRHQQATEAAPRGVLAAHARRRTQFIGAAFHATEQALGEPGVDHLHAMADADREDQERRQDVHRINAETQQLQDAKLPDHRHDRRQDRPDGQAERTGIEPQQHQRHHDGNGEEHHHRLGAIGNVAHHLGETDDVDLDLVVLVLLADGFELVGYLLVVQLAVTRILGDQLGPDHGAGEVLCHQSADDAGLVDVRADGLEILGDGLEARRVGREGRRNHVAAGKTVLDDFHESHVRGEDRTHAGIVHLVNADDVVGDLLHGLHEWQREHVAVARHDRDQYAVGATEFVLVLQEGLHVLMVERDLLLEAGVDLELAGKPHHRHGDRGEQEQDQRPRTEDEAFAESMEGTGLLGIHGIASLLNESRG